MQKGMEERDKKWNLQQQFREETYEAELKRRDQQWEEELQRIEEMFEAELQRKEKKWEEEMSKKEEQTEKENKKRKKRMEMKFPQFDPDLATLDLEPPNIFTDPSKRKKPSDLLIHFFHIPNL